MVVKLNKGKIFFFFAAMNMFNMIFSLYIPETIKLSLEQVDIIFGSVTKEERMADIAARARSNDLAVEGGSIGGGSYGSSYDEETKGDIQHVQEVPVSTKA